MIKRLFQVTGLDLKGKYRGMVRPLAVALVLGVLASGCTIRHEYDWMEYPVAPEKVTNSELVPGSTVSVVSAQPDKEDRDIGNVGIHHYFSSLQELSEAIVKQLSQELEVREVAVKPDADKTLEIKVTNTEFQQGMWVIRGNLRLQVKTGDGQVRDFFVSNKTPMTVPRAFNGAVTLAVIEILNDPEINTYLSH